MYDLAGYVALLVALLLMMSRRLKGVVVICVLMMCCLWQQRYWRCLHARVQGTQTPSFYMTTSTIVAA